MSYRILNENVVWAAVEPITSRAADEAVAMARSLSRVDTGTMRAGWRKAPAGRATYVISNQVPWTRWNEYGTRHMSAQPMLGPALAMLASRYGARGGARVGI